MDAEHAVHAVSGTVGDHRHRAGRDLLGGLEAQSHAARPVVAQRHQRARRTERHGHVSVVPARVHRAVVLGRDHAAVALLEDRQSVHVRSQHQHRAGPSAVQVGDDAGATDVRAHGEAQVGAAPRDELRGVMLDLRELGMAVQHATGLNHLFASPVDRGAEARLERSAGLAHDASPRLIPERRSATASNAPLLITRVAPWPSARRRNSRSA